MDKADFTSLIFLTLSTILAIATTLNYTSWQETKDEVYRIESLSPLKFEDDPLEGNLTMTSFTVVLSWFVPFVAFIDLSRRKNRKARKTLTVASELQPRYILHCLKPSKP